MSHVYRVSAENSQIYLSDRSLADRYATALADQTGQTVTIERLQLVDASPPGLACAILNGADWYTSKRTLRFVKPQRQAA